MHSRLLTLATIVAGLLGAMVWAAPAAAQIGLEVNVGGGGGAVPSIDVSAGDSGGTPPAQSAPPPNTAEPMVPLDQNLALDAVKSGRALPLEQVMAEAQLEAGGEIVDAKLVTVNAFLLYKLTVVAPDGDVSELYFYARSGERVRTN